MLSETADGETPVRGRRVFSFDPEKVSNLEHPSEIISLANTPSNFTVRSAYDTILSFVSLFPKETLVKAGGSGKRTSRELRGMRTTLRRLERLLKSENLTTDRGRIRAEEYERLARLWRERRDLERRQEVEEIRRRFWSAHFSGNSYLAWQIARSNLSGKGGGIRTSMGTLITLH